MKFLDPHVFILMNFLENFTKFQLTMYIDPMSFHVLFYDVL